MVKKYTVSILDGDKETPANFWIEQWGFVTRVGFKPQKEVRWEDLVEFSIEGPEQLQKRVTVTRLLAIGVFAFAKKKSSGESFIFARTKSEDQIVIKFNKKSEPELLSLFAPYKNKLPSEGVKSQNAKDNVVDQIAQLAELHSKGLLSDAEFTAMKSKLIN